MLKRFLILLAGAGLVFSCVADADKSADNPGSLRLNISMGAESGRTVAPISGSIDHYIVKILVNTTEVFSERRDTAQTNISVNLKFTQMNNVKLVVQAFDAINVIPLAAKEVDLTYDIIKTGALDVSLQSPGYSGNPDKGKIALTLEYPANLGISNGYWSYMLYNAAGSPIASNSARAEDQAPSGNTRRLTITPGITGGGGSNEFAPGIYTLKLWLRENDISGRIAGYMEESVIVVAGWVSDRWLNENGAYTDALTVSTEQIRANSAHADFEFFLGATRIPNSSFASVITGDTTKYYIFTEAFGNPASALMTIKAELVGSKGNGSLFDEDAGTTLTPDTGTTDTYTLVPSVGKNLTGDSGHFHKFISYAADGVTQRTYIIDYAVARSEYVYRRTLQDAFANPRPGASLSYPTNVTLLGNAVLSGNTQVNSYFNLTASGSRKISGGTLVVNAVAGLKLSAASPNAITFDTGQSQPFIKISGGEAVIENGVTLENNTQYAVTLESGKLSVNGGVIKNNTYSVYVNNSASFIMDRSALIDVGNPVYLKNGAFIECGTSILPALAVLAKITAETPAAGLKVIEESGNIPEYYKRFTTNAPYGILPTGQLGLLVTPTPNQNLKELVEGAANYSILLLSTSITVTNEVISVTGNTLELRSDSSSDAVLTAHNSFSNNGGHWFNFTGSDIYFGGGSGGKLIIDCAQKTGGISITNGKITLFNALIKNGKTSSGGGILSQNNSNVLLGKDSKIFSNIANNSGGIEMNGGVLYMFDGASIENNNATGGTGGGVQLKLGTYAMFEMYGGTITGNTAGYGGGVHIAGACTMRLQPGGGGQNNINNNNSAGGAPHNVRVDGICILGVVPVSGW